MPPGPMGAGPGARLPVDYAAEEGLDSPLWAGLKGAAAGVGAALPLVGRVSRRFAPPPIDTAPAPDAAGTLGTFGAQVLPGFTRGIPEMILAGRAGGLKGVMGAAAAGQADDLAYTEMLKRLQTGEEGNYLEDLATGSGIAASGPDDTAARRIMRGLTIPAAGGFAGIGGKLAGSAGLPLNLGFDVLSGLGETALNIGGQGGKIDPSQLALSGGMAGLASLLGGRPRLPVSARSADVAPPPEIPVMPDAGPRPEPELSIIPRSPVSPEPAPVGDYGSRPAPSLPAILEGLAPKPKTPPIKGPADRPSVTGSLVDGRRVRDEIPNMASIDAGLSGTDYEVLPGVKEVGLHEFTLDESGLASDKRTRDLAEQIKASGEINPLIVAYDDKGPYIIEGAHRYEALKLLGAKSFPAKVVLEETYQGPFDKTPQEPQNAPTGQFEAKMAAEKGRDNAALAKLQGKKKELDPRAEAAREYDIDKRVEYENAKTANPEFFAATEAAGMESQAALDLLSKTPGNIKTARAKASEAILSPKGPAGAQPLPETAQVTPPPVQPTDVRPPAGNVPRETPTKPPQPPSSDPNSSEIPNSSPKPLAETFVSGVKRGLKESEPLPVAAPKAGEPESAPAPPTPPAAKETALPGVSEGPIEGTAAKKASIFQDRAAIGLESVPSPERQAWQGELEKAIDEGLPEKSLDLAHDVLAKPRSLTVKETAGMTAARVQIKNRFAEADAKFKTAKEPAERLLVQAEKDRIKDEYDAVSRAMLASGTEKGRQLASQRMTLDDDLDLLPSVLRAEMNAGKPLDAMGKGRVESSSKRVMAAREEFEKAVARQSEKSAIDGLAPVKRSPEEVKALGDKLRSLLRNGCLVK